MCILYYVQNSAIQSTVHEHFDHLFDFYTFFVYKTTAVEYVLLSLKPAALRSIILGSSICMRPDVYTQLLPNNCLRPFVVFVSSFFCFFLWRCRFFRVFFVPLPFSLCMESTSYVFSSCCHPFVLNASCYISRYV